MKYKLYDDKTLRKLQLEEVDVLKEFDRLCTKYGLEYMAHSGTLLGAIRHKGFIPWDDDLDVAMPIEDYHKFLEISAEEYEGYGLYAPEKESGAFISFVPKFYKKGTKCLNYCSNNGVTELQPGIYIEIFPIVSVPDDIKEFEKFKKKISRLKKIYAAAASKKIIAEEDGIIGIFGVIAKYIVRFILKVLAITPQDVSNKYSNLIENVVSCGHMGTVSDSVYRVDKEIFEEVQIIPFEDMMVKAPKKAGDLLAYYYGENYMQLPPKEKRWNCAFDHIEFSDKQVY